MASITGISMVPMNVLLLAFLPFAGIMFDIQGSYKVPFTFMAVVSLIGSTLFLPLGRPEVPQVTKAKRVWLGAYVMQPFRICDMERRAS